MAGRYRLEKNAMIYSLTSEDLHKMTKKWYFKHKKTFPQNWYYLERGFSLVPNHALPAILLLLVPDQSRVTSL
jgi:hypothetical protein